MLGKQTRKGHSEVIGIMFTRCGAGLLSEPLARIGARYILLIMLELSINVFFCSVVGLDACSENIEAAREHLSLDPDLQERLSYQCCTVEEVDLMLNFRLCQSLLTSEDVDLIKIVTISIFLQHAENLEGPCYDAVVASEVIEHVDNPEIFLTYG